MLVKSGFPVFHLNQDQYRNLSAHIEHISNHGFIRSFGGFIIRPDFDVNVLIPESVTQAINKEKIKTGLKQTFTHIDGVIYFNSTKRTLKNMRTGKQHLAMSSKKCDTQDFFLELQLNGTVTADYFADRSTNCTENNLIDLSVLAVDHLLQFDSEYQHGVKNGGIHEPFGYFGTALSMSTGHFEDSNAGSANLLLAGASKEWFFVSGSYYQDMVDIYRSLTVVTTEERCCDNFYRRKRFGFLGSQMDRWPFSVYQVMQQRGDLVVTLPAAWHQVHNQGYNYAEAIQYVPGHWITDGIGKMADYCPHTELPLPWIDPDHIAEELEKDENRLKLKKLNIAETQILNFMINQLARTRSESGSSQQGSESSGSVIGSQLAPENDMEVDQEPDLSDAETVIAQEQEPGPSVRRKVGRPRKTFVCDKCPDRNFRDNEALLKHLKSHEKQEFKCETCQKIFVSKPEFSKHQVQDHGATDGLEKCETCGKFLKNKKGLAQHRYKYHKN